MQNTLNPGTQNRYEEFQASLAACMEQRSFIREVLNEQGMVFQAVEELRERGWVVASNKRCPVCGASDWTEGQFPFCRKCLYT